MSDKTGSKERGLVTGESKTLTTRSSSLVKRGLEALASQPLGTVRVPKDRSWKEFGIAVLEGLEFPFQFDIEFEDLPDNSKLGRVVESIVWINRAHPAYRRALASRSISYHIALAVAMAIAPMAVDSANENKFVTAFLSRWGAKVGPTT
jgi:hypothetical protein